MNIDDHLFLVGRPPLAEFIGAVKAQTNCDAAQANVLAEEWRKANDRVRSLEQSQPQAADNHALQAVPSALEARVKTLLESPHIKNAYGVVPFSVAMVELDKLVVFQKHINLVFVEAIKQKLGNDPDEQAILDLCIPAEPEPVAMNAARVSPSSFAFTSPSADIRVLDSTLLRPEQINDYATNGSLLSTLGLMVGAGANCLNAFQVNGRLVLNNGSHRAYALRSMGITHAPCLVQHITRQDELEILGTPEFMSNPNGYINAPRPSMLKDYFNQELIKVLPVQRKQRQIRINYTIEVTDVPEV